jgi:hypothetical protein
MSHPLPGGYKYGDLTLHVGGISDETVIYGYGSCTTLTSEWLHCKLQTCPIVREGALYEDRNYLSSKENKNLVKGPKGSPTPRRTGLVALGRNIWTWTQLSSFYVKTRAIQSSICRVLNKKAGRWILSKNNNCILMLIPCSWPFKNMKDFFQKV